MANNINWGKIYESTAWGSGVSDNSISWGKSYADLAGGGFTGLLDTYSGAAAAYSLRQLSSTYSGDAIVVRRASDNTTQSIGFVNNELDTTSLESFCSGTDGFVTTWYDQSGNGNNATQTTAGSQPKIVSAGSTILENGKAAVELITGSNQFMNLSNISFSSGITNFNVLKPNTDPSFWQYIYIYDGASNAYGISFSDNLSYDHRNIIMGTKALSNDSISADFTQQLLTAYYDGTGADPSDGTMHIDGASAPLNAAQNWGSVKTSSLLGFYPNANPLTNYFKGKIQEVILYDSDQSSNRSGIETNINDFYTIY